MSSWPRSTWPVLPTEPPPLPDYEALWEEAACGLLLTDANGLIRRANATFCRWIGQQREELVGKRRFQDLLTMGGRIFHQTHWAPLLQLQGSIAEVKLDLATAGGKSIPMMMNAQRREHGGVVFHEFSVAVADDRTTYERELMRARKQAEELAGEQRRAREALGMAETRLRMALEAGPLYVWEVDPATGRRDFDPGVALLLGLPEPGPVAFERYRDAIEPADLEVGRAAFARTLADPSQPYRASYRLNGVDGVQRTVLATARAVLDQDGRIHRIIGLLQDISEMSAQRAFAEDRALFAEQMIGIVSHDLRNPLSTIVMGGDALERMGLSQKQLDVLGRVRRAADRAHRLIADLLDFTLARLGRGLPVEPRPLDLHALVAEYVEELSLAHPDRRLVHLRDGSGEARGDRHRLGQLLGNLVSNAISYGHGDSPVTVTSTLGEGSYSLAVHNFGPVIAAGQRAALFQPMVRGLAMGSSNRSVGLGLYIVAEIARAHGGRVAVESDETTGTEFRVSIPLDAPVQVAPGG